jgi:hypothetical protein
VNANVKGSDAVARSIPKSAWTAGNATAADHIPMPAIVLRRRDMVSLSQAYGDPIIAVPLSAFMIVVWLQRGV